MIKNKMTLQEVEDVYKNYVSELKSIDDLYKQKSELESVSNNSNSSKNIVAIMQNEINVIDSKIKNIFDKQHIFVTQLIDYIFYNQIPMSYKTEVLEMSYRKDNGEYPRYVLTTFEGKIPDMLWDILHYESMFSLYYEGTKIPSSYAFTPDMSKEQFIATLNLYVSEGEPLKQA